MYATRCCTPHWKLGTRTCAAHATFPDPLVPAPSPVAPPPPARPTLVGTEWVVDAIGCDENRLRELDTLRELCDTLVRDLALTVVGRPQWHQFPDPGGVTGLYLLSESHLACHTYPEHRLATINLYCCRPRSPVEWDNLLRDRLGAEVVGVREFARGIGPSETGGRA